MLRNCGLGLYMPLARPTIQNSKTHNKGDCREMKTAKELVDQINSMELWSPNSLEDTMMDAGFDMDGVDVVTRVDLDEHRWYVLGTVVFKVGNEFFGVHGPVSLKSESMSYEDAYCKCKAFEMDEVPSVTYKKKNSTNGN